MTNNKSTQNQGQNDGANLKKNQVKLVRGLSNAYGSNPLYNLTFTLSHIG